jgi:hypothetical protein
MKRHRDPFPVLGSVSEAAQVQVGVERPQEQVHEFEGSSRPLVEQCLHLFLVALAP